MSDEHDIPQVLARYVRAADLRDGAAIIEVTGDTATIDAQFIVFETWVMRGLRRAGRKAHQACRARCGLSRQLLSTNAAPDRRCLEDHHPSDLPMAIPGG